MYSGECDANLKIKINGIFNLKRIFELADADLPNSERATFNGILPPSYMYKEAEY